jgi:hypothetical protein
MSKILNATPTPSAQTWKELFQAALLEGNSETLAQHIREARDAVMDEIEDTFQTASQTDRQSLIHAMNSLEELRRIYEGGRFEQPVRNRHFSDAA